MPNTLPESLLLLSDLLVPTIIPDLPTSKMIESNHHSYSSTFLFNLLETNSEILTTFPFDSISFSSLEDIKTKLLDFGFSSQVVSKFLRDYTDYILICVFSSPRLLQHTNFLPSSLYS